MSPGEIARTAISEIRGHKLRSSLTLLGIILGTLSITVMTSFLDGIVATVWQGFGDLGYDGVIYVVNREARDLREQAMFSRSEGLQPRDVGEILARRGLASLLVCTLIYAVVGFVATGLVPYTQLKGADPLARAFEVAGIGWGQAVISAGAIVSMTAVLLVFQMGQPRIFFSNEPGRAPAAGLPSRPPALPDPPRDNDRDRRRGGPRVHLPRRRRDLRPHQHRHPVRVLVVCLGVLALRLRDPERPRPFRVPLVWLVAPLGAAACLFVMLGLPRAAWIRFGAWMAVGIAIYFGYGFWHSRLRHGKAPPERSAPG